MGFRVFKYDVTHGALVEDLLDLRVRLSLAMEAAHPDHAAISAKLAVLKLEVAIEKRRPIP